MPRVIAIGDSHGCLTALQTLEESVPFRDDDQLIALGDYVDRGPDSAGVLDWIIERRERDQLVALQGNHEIMMLDAFRDPFAKDAWESVGGKQTLTSYQARGLSGSLDDIPESHRKLLRFQLLPYFQTDTHFFVHANAYHEVPLDQQPDYMLYWEKWNRPPRHISGKIMVCGHSSLRSGRPASNGDSICIDTAVYRDSGWLTCLDVKSGEYWQANEAAEFRGGWIGDLDES